MVLREETFEYYMYSFIFPYEIQNFISECNILTTSKAAKEIHVVFIETQCKIKATCDKSAFLCGTLLTEIEGIN